VNDDDGEVIGRRVAAALIDILIAFVLLVLVGIVTGDAEASDSYFSVELEGLEALIWALIVLAYYVATEARWGRTVGKKLLGIRVERLRGGRATTGAIALRNVLRAIDVLPILYLVGFTVLVTIGKRLQRLGDMAAGTAVVRG
jgi:uncharacterized RDD family membrane protein YckC